MRFDWWVVLVVAALWASATATALRNSQESGLRSRRRYTSPTAQDADSPVTTSLPTASEYSTSRQRGSRRRDDVEKTNVLRTRSRGSARNQQSESNEYEPRQTSPQTESNERVSSLRSTHIRTRKKPIEVEADDREETVSIKEPSYTRSRQKQTQRFLPRQSTADIPSSTENLSNYKFKSVPVETTKSQDIATTTTKSVVSSKTYFQPRSRGTTTTPRQRSESTTQKKIRSRINTRVLPVKDLPDHDASSSTITENIMQKQSITGRSPIDYRNSRKLRYRTKLSETESNDTGKGVSIINEVPKTSQNKMEVTSQEEIKSSTKSLISETLTSTEATSSSSPVLPNNNVNIARHPGARGKINFRPSATLSKTKSTEISEDDNYPESFKALIQAKNAAPHTNSTPRESLSVKASQKVYKTHTLPLQSTNTVPENQQKFRRFYKQTLESKSKESLENSSSIENTTNVPDLKIHFRKPDIRNRTSYISKYRKASTFKPSTSSTTSASISNESSRYKYNRKFKISTTESSKFNQNKVDVVGPKKALTRTSYYSRLRSSRVGTTSTEETANILNNNIDSTESTSTERHLLTSTKGSPISEHKETRLETTASPKIVNDITSQPGSTFFFQSRNLNKNDIASLNEDEQINNKNIDNVVVIPLPESKTVEYKMEDTNRSEESENVDIYQMMYTTPKYHSSYRDENESTIAIVENLLTSISPPIRNLHTRKNVAKFQKESEPNFNDAHTKTRETNMRKSTESFSKSTTAMMNGITAEPDKYKGRYSSKYRGHVDRPFYNPTVPSVTPSTAWLKFYITDKQLTKSIQDPDWFEEEQYEFKSTPMKGHYIIATSPIIDESSIELVEGEESLLGPDMNAISFSQTRSTLTSADLKLSESVLASSHIMNIEALRHSASVTVSIFDALADILTSTPKPQISTTKSVPRADNKEVTIQTFNGVSNTINVNNLQEFENIPNVSINADDNIKTVQITEQIIPVVNNQWSVEKNTSQRQNIEATQDPLSTTTILDNFPIPLSTTPAPARKPFAIKILYTNSDIPTSPNTPEFRQTWSTTTDNPTTVYNTVSDLILTNNKLVSSELSNVLSNNIHNILKNMDEESRSKISTNMAKLLKSLIPRALNGLPDNSDDVDFEPNTTPYSLEDLKETEVIIDSEIKDNNSNITSTNNSQNTTDNIFQTLRNKDNVNIDNLLDVYINVNSNGSSAVNSSSEKNTNTLSETINQEQLTDNVFDKTSITLSSFVDDNISTESITLVNDVENITVSTPLPTKLSSLPMPFLSNFLVIRDDTNDVTTTPIITNSVNVSNEKLSAPNNAILTKSSEPIITPGQLWLLNKKAGLLRVIEDLIQKHNAEIATATNSYSEDFLNKSAPSLSERLTQLVTELNMTDSNFTSNIDNTELLTPENPSTPIPTSNSPLSKSNIDTLISSNISTSTTESSSPGITTTYMPQTTESEEIISTTNIENIITTNSEQFETTTQVNSEDTTIMENLQTSTQSNSNTSFNTTEGIIEETTTISNTNNILQTDSTGTTNISGSSPPKKDYVIFGILPNNTVVRKDPNDNELESLTEASPYIIYGVLPNNTIIRKFPNGTRVPRVMEKIDILPISPWTLKNPYSPIHNNPAIVKPKYNPIRVISSTEITNNEPEDNLTNITVNNNQDTIPTSTTLNVNDSSFVGITTTVTNNSPAEASTASHVLSLRTTTMLPSVDEILLNSISSAVKEDKAISTITTSTLEPQILTLDIDPETKQIRTEKPNDGMGSSIFKFIPIENVTSSPQDTNVFKLSFTKSPIPTLTTSGVDSTEINTQTPQIPSATVAILQQTTNTQNIVATSSTTQVDDSSERIMEATTSNNYLTNPSIIARSQNENTKIINTITTNTETTTQSTETTTQLTTTVNTPINVLIPRGRSLSTPTNEQIPRESMTTDSSKVPKADLQFSQKDLVQLQDDAKILRSLLMSIGNNPTSQTTKNNQVNINVNQKITPPDVNQFEEDLKLLKALLEGTSQKAPSTQASTVIIQSKIQTTTPLTTTFPPTTSRTTPNTLFTSPPSIQQDIKQFQEDAQLLKILLQATGQNPENFVSPVLSDVTANVRQTTSFRSPTTVSSMTEPITSTLTTTSQNTLLTSPPSIQQDIKKFQEDAQLLKILLQATGQNPGNFVSPVLSDVTSNVRQTTSFRSPTTVSPMTEPITSTLTTTTQNTLLTSPPSIQQDIKKFQEDAQLLKILLQATGQNPGNFELPVLSDVTANVRKATGFRGPTTISPTTQQPIITSTNSFLATTTSSLKANTLVNLQSRQPTTAVPEDVRISTTFTNQRRRIPTTTRATSTTTNAIPSTISSRRLATSRFASTTETPSTSTFSVEEDLAFLENLKNVLNDDSADPETALANRIIALAVDRSLNEIKTNTDNSTVRSGKAISELRSSNNRIITSTTTLPTTTVYRRPTTTWPATRRPTTVPPNTPSLEDDIRQFEEDSKLLQALLKATGQDPSKFNIPTITNAKTNVRVSPNTVASNVNDDLKLLSNILASPSPLNEPFDSLTKNTASGKLTLPVTTIRSREPTSIKNDIKILQDDPKFLQTLIQLQENQEITTQRNKIVKSGLTSDEALSKLLKQQSAMVSEATRTPLAVSTEYGKSNDALLAALLKEQGFGPTTASSLDEQLRLAALLNQVVVTPKARRTTTTQAPPTARRPVLDGLAWLWQQWRETAPGPPRPNRRPAPTVSAGATSNRATWFGSGPFVGNAPEKTNSNRIPLEPPHAVAAEQPPGRGQIVSAAINVSRAFSQFLGAAIQGAAQTVQNVFKAGQKAASDVYTNGSG